MAELTRDEVVQRVKLKKSLARADLSGLDLAGAVLEGIDFGRADLEGTNLEGAKLRGANLRSASLREAFLKGADLSDANLEKADLEGANLEGSTLRGANLNRATLEGATLTQAVLVGARLTGAQLESADLGKADLQNAVLSHAELGEAYLGGAKLGSAELSNADLTAANLEEADLSKAILNDAELEGVKAPSANFSGATLMRCNFSKAILTNANLTGVDARHANFDETDLGGAILTGARLFSATTSTARYSAIQADWLDGSPNGDSSKRITGEDIAAFLAGKVAPGAAATRYFGEGDVLRDATLEFGEGSSIEIDSRFEKCSIALGEGTDLVVGEAGVLSECMITGGGNITIHGQFFEKQSPGIVGPRRLVVSSCGSLVGAVQQNSEDTVFAFQPGCRLRMKILRRG